MDEAERIRLKYETELLALKVNSKPLINALTMMAEDHIRNAPVIVQAIEHALHKVRQDNKLPLLYLIDSILKNVKKTYVNLFTQNIVSTFCGTFEKVDDKTKKDMFKLRQTWNEVITPEKLYAVDVRCNQLDSKWPVTATPGAASLLNPSIHVNPRFLGRTTSDSTRPLDSVKSSESKSQTQIMKEELLLKQTELLELKQKKLELELMQAKAQLEEKERQEKEREMQEALKQQESQLLHQAQKAKMHTDKAANIIASAHKPNDIVPKPVVEDPRLARRAKQRLHDLFEDNGIGGRRGSLEYKPNVESVAVREQREDKDRPGKSGAKDTKKHSGERLSEFNMFQAKGKNDKKNENKERFTPFRDSSRSVSREKDIKPALSTVPDKKEKSRHKDDDSRKNKTRDDKRDKTLRDKKPNDSKHVDKSMKKDLNDSTESDKKVESLHGSKSRKSEERSESEASYKSDESNAPRNRRKDSASVESTSPSSSNSSPRKRKRSPVRTKKPSRSERKRNNEKGQREKERHDLMERKSAVLGRTYRKKTDVTSTVVDEPIVNQETLKRESIIDGPMRAVGQTQGDTDLRFAPIFDPMKDTDLRGNDGSLNEPPPLKKSRPNPLAASTTNNIMDDLFGGEDVDLRMQSGISSNSWSQIKKPVESGECDMADTVDEIIKGVPPQMDSPSNGFGPRGTCDPLGRPLLYNRLPDDPSERKRSLDSRTTAVEPIEKFRKEYIDPVLALGGEFDTKPILLEAHKELESGVLNSDEYLAVIKLITRIHETTKIRELQQMQDQVGAKAIAPVTWAKDAVPSNSTIHPWASGTTPGEVWSNVNPVAAVASVVPAVASVVPAVASAAGIAALGELTALNRFPTTTAPTLTNNLSTWRQATPAAAQSMVQSPWDSLNPVRPVGPNPFEAALVVDDVIPVANEPELRAAEEDVSSSIPIDKVMRQVRFYGDTAILLMGMMNDEPKEIYFQRDNINRVVMINGKPLDCRIGETRWFDLNRRRHKLRLGCPTRELYVDDRHYELCFGGPSLRILVDGRQHVFQLKGPPPQVEIGKKPRYDLLAGRVNLMLDAVNTITVYLDEKPQKIDFFGFPVVLRFGDRFHTVFLNGRPFPTKFGARLPFSVTTASGRKHYLRFSAVSPSTEKAMVHFINMRGQLGPEPFDQSSGPAPLLPLSQYRGRNVRSRSGTRGRGFGSQPGYQPQSNFSNDENHSSPKPTFENSSLDLLANVLPQPGSTTVQQLQPSSISNSSINKDITVVPEESAKAPEPLNVGELLNKLMQHGLLPAPPAKDKDKVADVEDNSNKKKEPQNVEIDNQKSSEPDDKSKSDAPSVEHVVMSFDDNMKERRGKLVLQLCNGVQCASCGLRFSSDQTLLYSQHLDWHFRHNRREKANAKKIQNRKWYYDLSDWIQFEEIEDLEERAASMFEHPEEEANKSPNGGVEVEVPSVLSQNHEGAICPQCKEGFESYFDEEKEEWRLRDALLDEIEGESKLYHSVCHEDYMKSLVDDSTMEVEKEYVTEVTEGDEEKEGELEEANKEEKEGDDDDEVMILKEGKKEVVMMEIDIAAEEEEEEAEGAGLEGVKEAEVEDDGVIVVKDSVEGEEMRDENIVMNVDIQNEKVNNEQKDNGAQDEGDNERSKNNSNNNNKKEENVLIANNDNDGLSNVDVHNDDDKEVVADGGALPSTVGETADEAQPAVCEAAPTPTAVDVNDDSNNDIFFLATMSTSTPDVTDPASSVGRNARVFDWQDNQYLPPMVFDHPPIKVEPMDEPMEDAQSHDAAPDILNMPGSPVEIIREVPVISLDDECSLDTMDDGALAGKTQIDGNLAMEAGGAQPLILPAAKIKINLTGIDTASPKGSPKNSNVVDEEDAKSPRNGQATESSNLTVSNIATESSNDTGIVDDNKKDSNLSVNEMTEKMKRLKPRLVGRKLVNCPPKFTGKEESGLCSIV